MEGIADQATAPFCDDQMARLKSATIDGVR